MDREQDNFFEDESKKKQDRAPETTQQSAPAAYDDNDNDHAYLMNLLGYLQDAIEMGSSVPLTGKRLVDADMCLDIIRDIRGNLPLAIQYADQVMRDRDRILSNAERSAANRISSADVRANASIENAEQISRDTIAEAESRADKIIKDAEIRARAMIDQNAIKIAAQNEARAIVNEARAEANERRLDASAYGEGLLTNVEKELMRAVDMVRARRQNISDDVER